MFRAQWMFELAPGVSSSGLEPLPCRTSSRGPGLKSVDTRGKQEIAKEEKVQETHIFWTSIVLHFLLIFSTVFQ